MQEKHFSVRGIPCLKNRFVIFCFHLKFIKFINLIFLFFELYYNTVRNWYRNCGQYFFLFSMFL